MERKVHDMLSPHVVDPHPATVMIHILMPQQGESADGHTAINATDGRASLSHYLMFELSPIRIPRRRSLAGKQPLVSINNNIDNLQRTQEQHCLANMLACKKIYFLGSDWAFAGTNRRDY